MAPGPAIAWAQRLQVRGMSAQDIADRSGVSVTLVRRLLRAVSRPIARTTADAVLGVTLPPRHLPTTPGLTSAGEASRLLADLERAGWPATLLARRLAVHPRTIAEIRFARRTRIHLDLDVRIRELHRHLIPLDPVSEGVRAVDAARIRTLAQRRAA